MSERKLNRPPIVEAILDIDCDLPPGLALASLEGPAKDRFKPQYPKFKTRHLFEHEFRAEDGVPPQAKTRRDIHAYLFLQDDEKQLVQVRAQGYSFNRLAPYSELDDYLNEVERTWSIFVELAQPIRATSIRLQYINRILLPLTGGELDLNDYLKRGPSLPDEERLALNVFLLQYVAVEKDSGNSVRTVLTAQQPESNHLPILFDIAAERAGMWSPSDWKGILGVVQSLRKLKNDVFFNSLEEKCLTLFR